MTKMRTSLCGSFLPKIVVGLRNVTKVTEQDNQIQSTKTQTKSSLNKGTLAYLPWQKVDLGHQRTSLCLGAATPLPSCLARGFFASCTHPKPPSVTFSPKFSSVFLGRGYSSNIRNKTSTRRLRALPGWPQGPGPAICSCGQTSSFYLAHPKPPPMNSSTKFGLNVHLGLDSL